MSARFSDRLPCDRSGTADSSLSRATMATGSPLTTVASGQSSGARSVEETMVAGRSRMRVTHWSLASSGAEASIAACARYVVAPKTIRWSPANTAARCASSSGPCLPQ